MYKKLYMVYIKLLLFWYFTTNLTNAHELLIHILSSFVLVRVVRGLIYAALI